MRTTTPGMRFFAHFFIVLAAWTVVIKYLFPIGMSIALGEPLTRHILWDFWWVIHLTLTYSLLSPKSWTLALCLGTSLVEVGIVATKFFLFFQSPEWTLWKTNWFINKLFVLGGFTALLVYCITIICQQRRNEP